MGNPDVATGDQHPVRNVTVDSFFMMRTEVTFDQYDAYLNAKQVSSVFGPFGRGDQPLVNVNWYRAIAFANWLSEQDDLRTVYSWPGSDANDYDLVRQSPDLVAVTWDQSANGWRLPTEAEWEYAARGGRNTRGTLFAGNDDLNLVAWYRDNSGQKARLVATKEPNELGIFDLSGNVFEWCFDRYGPYEGDDLRNPVGPLTGHQRVLRGGGHNSEEMRTLVTSRDREVPQNGYHNRGFRLVRSYSPSFKP